MDALVPYTGTRAALAGEWAALLPDERHRRAALACLDRDVDQLADLMEAGLALYGSAGVRVSRHTVRSYRIGVAELLRRWSGVNLLRPTPDDVARFVMSLEHDGLSASTIKVRLAAARALYRALRWAGAVTENPLRDARVPGDPTPPWEKRQPYSDADVRRLLNVATHPERVIVLLGAHAGLRNAEMVTLTWGDIELRDRRLVVCHGKGGSTRSVLISRSLEAALVSVPAGSGAPADRVLLVESEAGVRLVMRQLCERAGVPYRGVHALRHSCATRIYRETGRLEDAQRQLGHKQLSTTQRYTHYVSDALERSLGDW